ALDRVEVTGSRIKRTDIETAQPVTIIQRADIERTGLTSLGELLPDLPSAGSTINTNVNNGGTGATLIDMRNLGPRRTLVLVNGRRWVNSAGGNAGVGGAVDLNTVPISVVERVEVLKDGASAIYGSDAIAGVINIITRKDFDGGQANAQYGEYDEGDGTTEAYDFSIGSTGSRHTAFLNVSYVQQDKVSAGDRRISQEPVIGGFDANNAVGASIGTPQGVFIFNDTRDPAVAFGVGGTPVAGCGTTTSDSDGDGNPDGSFCFITTPPDSTFSNGGLPVPGPGDFINAGPANENTRFNFAPDNHLLTPQERIGFYAQGSYEINDWLSFSTEILYNNRQSDQTLAPEPLFLGTGAGLPNSALVDISATNAFNPFGVDLIGTQNLFLFGRRMVENGPRKFRQDVDTFRFGAAFEGSFEAGGRFFDWDAGYVFGQNEGHQTTTGQLNLERIANALGPSGAAIVDAAGNPTGDFECLDGAGNVIPGCVSLNVFGGQQGGGIRAGTPGSMTQAQLDYISSTQIDTNFQELINYTANLSGEIVDLPGGPLGFAVGYEYRREEGFDQPDILSEANISSGNNRQATSGSFTLNEAYVELAIPVHRTFNVSIASRFTNFENSAGADIDTDTQKIGFEYRPHSDWLIRGTFSEGFRAPNINELFGGSSDSFPALADPCADNPNQPGSQFAVPGALNCPRVAPAQGNPQIRITVGSNPNLTPETAENITAGIVFSPSFWEGLSLSLDYWKIEIDNAIVGLTGQQITNGCHINNNQSQCDLITRNNAGAIVDLIAAGQNIGGLETEGIDFSVSYNLPEFNWGRIRLVWDTTYLDEFDLILTNPDGSESTTSFVGTNTGSSAGGAYPNWKSNLDATWSYGHWEATWGMQFIGDQLETCPVGALSATLCSNPAPERAIIQGVSASPFNHIGSTTYHDVQVSYHWEDWRFTVGIDNITDKDPPISFSAASNSYDPSVYRVPGRFPYLRISKSF
ncbi:MAG: TonB-dependent receptor, partial [Gammaproteobacteria bacterium]|nr:TonB-dependent receptor [Gammaproteobacteria bacterium]